jgi:hypothetical protein
MSDTIPTAPYKHSEWAVGEIQTAIQVQPSPATLERIAKVIAESVEEQFPALRVCVVNVPMIPVDCSVIHKQIGGD